MAQLPERPSLEHLKSQAKDLLRACQRGEAQALARLRAALPAGEADADITALRLHDAQFCLAREYGFTSWPDLKAYIEAHAGTSKDIGELRRRWLRLVYADVAGGFDAPRPLLAARTLAEHPDLGRGDPWLACTTGDAAAVREAAKADPQWVNRAGGALNLPPLVAVTLSSLLRLPAFHDGLAECARLLLDAGADPNQAVEINWSASANDAPQTVRLSALYGAAGQNHDPELTKLLLDAGADPNDGESLYHGLESSECTRLLLEAGARVVGSNAFYRVFDLDSIAALRLLLAYGADPNEPAPGRPTSDWGTPLLWAIRRRRSRAHVEALLEAGADAAARTPEGVSAYRLALQFGLADVARLLEEKGLADPVPQEEAFIAACARGDAGEARRIQALRPDLPGALSETQLRLLPELAAQSCDEAVRLMVELGWPIAVRAGDWNASALNLAVFRGDSALAHFLLEHGASWTEKHGYGSDVLGTLGWGSRNEPVPDGDWVGCAKALLDHGIPRAEADPERPGWVRVGGDRHLFSEEVTALLLAAGSG